MDVDDENSNKRLKTQPEREMTMQDEQSVDDEKKGLLLQQHRVQIREYYFHDEGSAGYDSRYTSKLFLATRTKEERFKRETKSFSLGEKVSRSTIIANFYQGFRDEHP